MRFDNRQQCNNTSETASARQIELIDESIGALMSTLLAQVTYDLMLTVNVAK